MHIKFFFLVLKFRHMQINTPATQKRAHKHMYTCTLAQIHKHNTHATRAKAHKHTQTHKRISTPSGRKSTRLHAHLNKHSKHTYTHATRAKAHKHTRTSTPHKHTRTSTRTQAHTQTHTQTHTSCTHARTQPQRPTRVLIVFIQVARHLSASLWSPFCF